MALHPPSLIILLLSALLAFSWLELSTCQFVKAKVSCLDCTSHYDFSGIKVAVKCEKVKKLATAATKRDGLFEVELPSSTPLNCIAKLMGGSTQLYATRKDMFSKIVRTKDDDDHNSLSYTISTPLAFSTNSTNLLKAISESKTVDLPLPREWGLAPSSYYVPFFPIIGIP